MFLMLTKMLLISLPTIEIQFIHIFESNTTAGKVVVAELKDKGL